MDAIVKEIEQPKFPFDVSGMRDISTLYFGGGTPGLLPAENLEKIVNAVHKNFNMQSGAEFTLEVNPDNVNPATLKAWRNMGANRLSMGVQSFFDEDLVWMNRTHDAAKSKSSVLMAQDAGFENISIDLIYGLPASTKTQWQRNLETAVSLSTPHLSCYALTVEGKTALAHAIENKRQLPPDDKEQAEQFTMMVDYLEAQGFDHYEISNFGKPGWRSKHNTHYWSGMPYLGFGPAAHSFNGENIRSWNVANNALYMRAVIGNGIPNEMEILSRADHINERIMTLLRTNAGIELNEADLLLGDLKISSDEIAGIQGKVEFWQNAGKLEIMDGYIKLTKNGKLFADGIASSFFVT